MLAPTPATADQRCMRPSPRAKSRRSKRAVERCLFSRASRNRWQRASPPPSVPATEIPRTAQAGGKHPPPQAQSEMMVECIKAGKAAPVIRHGLPKVPATGERQATFRLHQRKTQIVAELIGSDICAAHELTATGNAPILALCRLLVRVGYDPALRLECYRGDVLALVVASIAEGAALEINSAGNGFRPAREPDAAPPMRSNGRGRA